MDVGTSECVWWTNRTECYSFVVCAQCVCLSAACRSPSVWENKAAAVGERMDRPSDLLWSAADHNISERGAQWRMQLPFNILSSPTLGNSDRFRVVDFCLLKGHFFIQFLLQAAFVRP